MSNVTDYLEELSKFFDYVNSRIKIESRVDLYILKKDKGDFYEYCKYGLSNDIMQMFVIILKDFIEKTFQKDQNIIYRHFYDLNYSKDNIRYISTTEVPNIENIINQIYQFSNLPTCEDIKKLNNIIAYAIEISDREYKKIIYFKKKEQIKLLKHKAILTNGVLNKIENNVLEFDDKVDFIFVEKLKTIIILNEENFEIIFKFRDFYIKNCNESLNELEGTYVTINKSILKEIQKLNIQILKNIVKLQKNDKFKQIKNNDIIMDYFKDQQKIIQKINPDKLKFDIRNNKITIKDKKELKDFLDACNDTYVRSLARRNLKLEPDLFESLEKNLLK